jgi:hypothetical protein
VSLEPNDLISEFTTRDAQSEPLQRSVTPSRHTRRRQDNPNRHLEPHSEEGLLTTTTKYQI